MESKHLDILSMLNYKTGPQEQKYKSQKKGNKGEKAHRPLKGRGGPKSLKW